MNASGSTARIHLSLPDIFYVLDIIFVILQDVEGC